MSGLLFLVLKPMIALPITKKEQMNQYGEVVKTGSDSYHGSFVFGAFVDTMFLLAKWKKKKGDEDYPYDRMLYCTSQRSGEIVTGMRIRLSEPDPLHFSTVDKYEEEKQRVTKAVYKEFADGVSMPDLVDHFKKNPPSIGRSILYNVVGELEAENVVRREGTKQKLIFPSG